MMNQLYYLAALINQKNAGIPSASNFKLVDILHTIYFWAGAIAVIIIIVAGFMYVTAANNAQQVTRAKNAILSSVIGLVVILAAYGITTFVLGVAK